MYIHVYNINILTKSCNDTDCQTDPICNLYKLHKKVSSFKHDNNYNSTYNIHDRGQQSISQ